MKKIIFILSIFLAQISTALATNYYVSKSGNDSNAGTESEPFLSIAKASSMLTAGDTCFIMEGTYRETIIPKSAGQDGNPIVYTNYNNEEVLISATEIIDTWEQHEGNIYKANYAMKLGRQNMVFCDDKPMDYARWPNNTDDDVYTIDAWDVESGSASTVLGKNLPEHSWVGGLIWYLGAHSGASWTREITASTTSMITFTEVDITKWPFDPHNPTVFRNNNRGRFYLMGVLDALDYEREWFYENGSVYFQAPGNVDPSTLKVEVSARDKAIDIGKSYVHIDGLKVFGGRVEVKANKCILKNMEIKHGLETLDRLDNTGAQVAEGAIFVRGVDNIITQNTIDGSSLNGIYVAGWGGSTQVDINNNYIRNTNTVGIHASPIRNAATNSRIYGNTIETTGRDGIYNGANNCEIAYNDVSDCMRINNDGGVYYTVGNADDKNVEIHHNWFHDSEGPDYADGRAAGIYLDNHSKGYSVHHNVVWNITWSGIQLNWDNWNIDIYNNSIYEVEEGMGRWENGFTLDDVVLKNNYASILEFIGTDINDETNIISDQNPFASVENHDFRPSVTSYLIDKGEVIEGYTDGFVGNAPDIGAYEYGLTPWIPGVNPVIGGEIDTDAPDPNPSNPTDPDPEPDPDPTPDPEPETPLNTDTSKSSFRVFPNPLENTSLKVKTEKVSNIKIYDLTGSLLPYNSKMSLAHSIPRSTFRFSGMYLITIESEDNVYYQRVVVQ
ncbi:T9SS type A sorting domain-containing protein [Sediminitomix flava]|uniref:Putative secreted protein (Por secretion system target) n=1 Tax=Sediminitomix flava TaxID=379075 RepID=A0A315ZSW5_SEDFL|nr:T9SS type A sorting domain-containing protein [Sediminitomix flava]PWJ37950.1 putative secreted protein (Por secretion system target) [Sediminitomix flava]